MLNIYIFTVKGYLKLTNENRVTRRLKLRESFVCLQ